MIPAEVFHVGEYLGDELDERGWTVERLADATGIPAQRWSQVLTRTAGLLGTEAQALERIGWGRAELWLHLNHKWRRSQGAAR